MGTRVYYYVYKDSQQVKPTEEIKGEKYEERPLQSFGSHWEKKALHDFLGKIMNHVADTVREKGWEKQYVDVQILATEGMREYRRQVSAKAANRIMTNVGTYFEKRCSELGFDFLRAEIILGRLEALGSWIDANIYYPPKSGPSKGGKMKTVGIIEMGGASVQIQITPRQSISLINYGINAGMRYLAWEKSGRRKELKQMTRDDLGDFSYEDVKDLFFNEGKFNGPDDPFRKIGGLPNGWQDIVDIMPKEGKHIFRLAGSFPYRAKDYGIGAEMYFSKLEKPFQTQAWKKLTPDPCNTTQILKFHTLFHRALYKTLGKWIDDTETGPADIKWARGVIIMRKLDTNNNLELEESEMRELLPALEKEIWSWRKGET